MFLLLLSLRFGSYTLKFTSKNISETLVKTPAFTSACSATFAHSISLSQHQSGLHPYQLLPASIHLHSLLTRSSSPSLPLLSKWAPPPPTRARVDSAFRKIREIEKHDHDSDDDAVDNIGVVDEAEFERFCVELYTGMIVERVVRRRAVVVGAGAVGLGGVFGGAHVVGRVAGVCLLGFAVSAFLGLS